LRRRLRHLNGGEPVIEFLGHASETFTTGGTENHGVKLRELRVLRG
jgi:hypothetical protein